MKNYKLQKELDNYILNPRDGMVNFKLANEYFSIGQYAGAMSYYLRCAEISNDKELVYESLLNSWACMKNVEGRPIFERGQLMTTIAQSPDRPEAYYFICNWLEIHGNKSFNSNEEKFHQMYLYACIGINNIENHKEFLYFKEYPGYYGLMFYKGFAAWQIGKLKESEEIFIDLYNNHKLDKDFKQYVYNNIKNLNIENKIVVKNNKKDIKSVNKYWNITDWPTMEITTTIPKKGCVVDCVFCPQRTLQKVWDSKHFTTHKERTMSMEQFKIAIDKLPTEVRITFSGFIEPYMNKHCSDMMVYAHEQGHRVSVFTTAVGMKLEDVEKIKHIPFCGGPNGGFTLHLPDQERRAKHPVTDKYIKVVEALKNANISNFMVMAMGTTHNKVTHLYPDYEVNKYKMWHRAGNLVGEAQLKPELTEVMNEVETVFRNDERTCGCIEDLYHNILLPNGDVSLCCMDYNLEEILGNLYTQEYDDIMPKKNTTYDMCSRCENGVIPSDESCQIGEEIPDDSEFDDEKWRRILPYIGKDYTTAVETGTYLGATTKYLATQFNRVHTIELDEGLFKEVEKSFKNNKNIKCHLGDSSTVLREKIIDELNNSEYDKKVFFFLDAHWSGDDNVDWENSKWKGAYSYARGKNTAHRGNTSSPNAVEQVPLEEEIMHIYNNFKNECLICVDDWDKIDKDGIGKKNAEFVGEDWSNINFNIIKDKIKDRLVGNPFMIDNYKLMIKLKAK
jgi:tetratricopeptide (TPR) repeat protein